MKPALEKDVQNSICKYLSLRRHFFWRNNNVPISDMKRGKRIFRKMPKYGMKGIPDIIVITVGGYAVFLEVKRKNTKQSPDQVVFAGRIKDLGGEYYVVRSIDDVKQVGL